MSCAQETSLLIPEDIEKRDFLISLRGFDRTEVRAFLVEVAAYVRELEGRLQVAQRGATELSTKREEEAEGVLQAARAAAKTITDAARADAEREVSAAREQVVRELRAAHEEAAGELEAVRQEAARERDTARQEAAGELEAVRQEAARERDTARQEAAGERDTARQEAAGELEAARQESARERDTARQEAAGELEAARQEAASQVETAREESARLVADGERRRRELEEVIAGLEAVRDRLAADIEEAERTVRRMREQPPAPEQTQQPRTPDPVETRPPRAPAPVETAAALPRPPKSTAAYEAPSPRAVDPSAEVAGPSPARTERPDPHVLRQAALEPLHPQLVRGLRRGLEEAHDLLLYRLRRSMEQPGPPLTEGEVVAGLAAAAGELLACAYRAGELSAGRLAGRRLGGRATAGRDLVGAFTPAAAEQVRDHVAAAVELGRSGGSPLLEERIGAVFAEMEGHMAEELAAMQLIRAYELGLIDAWAAGGVTHRRWVTGRETRCPEARCRHNADVDVVAVGRPYPSGHDAPPAHVGCTCTTIPVSEPPR